MQSCQELLFNLVSVYALPQDKTASWFAYPWNVPFGPSVTSIKLTDMGFNQQTDAQRRAAFMSNLRQNALHLTSYPQTGDPDARTVYCDESLQCRSTQSEGVAGISFTNSVKCNALHLSIDHRAAAAAPVAAPHDLVLVSDSGELFVLRASENGYRCRIGENVSATWNSSIEFELQNCHGVQQIV